MSLKKVDTIKVIENRLTMLNFLILKSIFVDYLKLLYGLKHNLHIISRKKIEFEIIETDLQAA